MDYPQLTNSNLAPCPICGELPHNSFYNEEYGQGSAGTGYRIECKLCGIVMVDDGYDEDNLSELVSNLENKWNNKWKEQ